jgi:hypothetical protein
VFNLGVLRVCRWSCMVVVVSHAEPTPSGSTSPCLGQVCHTVCGMQGVYNAGLCLTSSCWCLLCCMPLLHG